MPFGMLDVNKGAPAVDLKTVTPADGTDLPDGPCRGLYVGGAGNISLDTAANTTVTVSGIPAGTVLPFEVKRVRNTLTTATLILAIY